MGLLPHWVFPTAFVSLLLAAWIGTAYRNTRKLKKRLKARRESPSKSQFINLMGADVSDAAASFLWETALQYLQPDFAPHPDDDLVHDLWIDDGDWSMDWPSDFAVRHGFSDDVYPDWPKGKPVTIRNFGLWLDAGQRAARES